MKRHVNWHSCGRWIVHTSARVCVCVYEWNGVNVRLVKIMNGPEASYLHELGCTRSPARCRRHPSPQSCQRWLSMPSEKSTCKCDAIRNCTMPPNPCCNGHHNDSLTHAQTHSGNPCRVVGSSASLRKVVERGRCDCSTVAPLLRSCIRLLKHGGMQHRGACTTIKQTELHGLVHTCDALEDDCPAN